MMFNQRVVEVTLEHMIPAQIDALSGEEGVKHYEIWVSSPEYKAIAKMRNTAETMVKDLKVKSFYDKRTKAHRLFMDFYDEQHKSFVKREGDWPVSKSNVLMSRVLNKTSW